jgi:hypothetical protein
MQIHVAQMAKNASIIKTSIVPVMVSFITFRISAARLPAWRTQNRNHHLSFSPFLLFGRWL